MNEVIKDIYEKLNDEQKKKVDACKSEDELMELFSEWDMDIELPDDLVEAVGGGLYTRALADIGRFSVP